MKVVLAALVVVAAFLLAPAGAEAHPLGNFTVNRYAGIEASGGRVFVHYALDLAEIPTFQIGDDVRRPGYPVRLARELELTLDGKRVPLRVLDHKVAALDGAGGLRTLRLDVVYEATATGSELRFQDNAFPDRIGWREVTLSARDGAEVSRSSVPETSASDELRAYPKDLLSSPSDVSTATASVDLAMAIAAVRMISLMSGGSLSHTVLLIRSSPMSVDWCRPCRY